MEFSKNLNLSQFSIGVVKNFVLLTVERLLVSLKFEEKLKKKTQRELFEKSSDLINFPGFTAFHSH